MAKKRLAIESPRPKGNFPHPSYEFSECYECYLLLPLCDLSELALSFDAHRSVDTVGFITACTASIVRVIVGMQTQSRVAGKLRPYAYALALYCLCSCRLRP